MKKIMIQESNNQLINSQAQSFILPNEDEWKELRTYILQHGDFSGLTDFDLFLEVIKWVNDRWTHDGMNDAGDASSLEILRRADDGESSMCGIFKSDQRHPVSHGLYRKVYECPFRKCRLCRLRSGAFRH